jgi:hypothetical protein
MQCARMGLSGSQPVPVRKGVAPAGRSVGGAARGGSACGWRLTRRGPGRPPAVTDAELACPAVAQVLLQLDDERHWLRAAPRLAAPLFPRPDLPAHPRQPLTSAKTIA